MVSVSHLEIISLGTIVGLGDNLITGHVHAVSISLTGGTQYQVVYWGEGERKEVWVSQDEMDILGQSAVTTRIGFK